MLLNALIGHINNPKVIEDDSFDNLEAIFPKIPSDFLASMCAAEDRKPESSRLSEDTDYVHVSSLLDLCPRQYALARSHKLRLTEKVSPNMRIVWEMGKALEKHAIKNITNYYGEDLVYPGELIYNDEYMIQGAPDLLIETQNAIIVTEIKTMNARDFDKLEAARGDHILQAALYRWLLDEHIELVHDHVILLYISKDFIRGNPYKEFHINTKDVNVQNGVRIALDLAKELKDARARGRIPARRICSRPDCARAKNCPTAALCFESPEEEYVLP